MNAAKARPPLWNKSIARMIAAKGHGAGEAESPEEMPNATVDAKILERLGLAHLISAPKDPRLLVECLLKDDATDAAADVNEFTRGVRRAVRLRIAFAAKLHRHAGLTWVKWVEQHFQAGYRCFQRYHVAAEIQVGLISRGLALLENEHQSRSIAPMRKHERFWAALAVLGQKVLPPANELHDRLARELGLWAKSASATPRIKLHRILSKVVRAVPKTDDACVGEALELVRQAIALLESGGAS